MIKRRVIFLMAIFIMQLGLFLPMFSVNASALSKSKKVCASVSAGSGRCFASVLTDSSGITPQTSTTPKGYGPADFKAAYNVHGNSNLHIGIVTAYDAPTIQNDLAAFSRAYGLPILPTCTAAGQAGCFEKLNQRGATGYPVANSGWAVETSLDVETAHGQCPGCSISLIEASSPTIANFSAAEDMAAARGARVISNSYGGPESSGEAQFDNHFKKSGVAIVVSSGDSGYGTTYPAASANVIAVGGTSLHMSNGRVITETAWSGSGSGCSLYEYKPNWQHDSRCSMRSIADIAADADPNTGAAIYDSTMTSGRSGWFTVGGTSLAAPLVAGIIGASGLTTNQPANFYGSPSVIRDITSGTNGACATYLCRATAGYDGPTGLGVL